MENEMKSLLGRIWDMFLEVETDITYSSLLCEKARKKQTDIYFWGIYVFSMLLPSGLNLLISHDIFDKKSISINVLCIIFIIAPPLIRFIKSDFAYRLLGVKEKKINDLLDLNENLEIYASKLLSLYFNYLDKNATKSNIELARKSFESLNNEHKDDRNKHDLLTGHMDKKLLIEAKRKTEEAIKNKTWYQESI